MSDGLKRANQAAYRSRLKITERHREFLDDLRHGSAGRFEIALTDRAQDRVRQACRRAGLAYYKAGRWYITEHGQAVIDP